MLYEKFKHSHGCIVCTYAHSYMFVHLTILRLPAVLFDHVLTLRIYFHLSKVYHKYSAKLVRNMYMYINLLL